MRRLFLALATLSAAIVPINPAWAEIAKPDPVDCVAAAEASRTYWQALSGKNPVAAEREIALASTLIEKLGDRQISPAQRKKYKDLIPDFRDVFIRRCLAAHDS